jgi:hypothetical protein
MCSNATRIVARLLLLKAEAIKGLDQTDRPKGEPSQSLSFTVLNLAFSISETAFALQGG